ncbi:hypothetical protein [[Clostridium] fimetarium]|uniref:Uncharacterized protein n=1 Tax=[Clostridium] fimetarium TaxID=99656 RepID=A0A1I0QVG4_9FIRM|nr:hypothetical protein [[Clostridium] fimetarium]SEW31632.1 hypothetical protein SAMN05421659_109167 [[Clostridium] fimetarium]
MGYPIEMTGCKFIIKKEDFKNALEGLKSVFTPEIMPYKTYDNDGKECYYFSWVNTKTVLESTTLEEAMKKIRYTPIFNLNGDICKVEFTGESNGDDAVFFDALAPYVQAGSYLRFKGGYGEKWKWIFEDGEVEYTH